MKNHYVFVEEDGTFSWSRNPRTLWRGEGSTHTDCEVRLGSSTWKVAEKEGRLTIELFDKKGRSILAKVIRPGGLYKVQPRLVTTMEADAVRGKKGFESRNPATRPLRVRPRATASA